PARVRDVDRSRRDRELLSRSTPDVDARAELGLETGDPAPGGGHQRFVRLHAGHVRGASGEQRKMKAGAAADVEHRLRRPVMHPPHRRLEYAIRIDTAVLEFVDTRMVPDVRA